MSTQTNDNQALEALGSIERELSQQQHPAQRGAAEALDLKALCQQYQKIKSLLNLALPLIERIPVYGAKVGLAVRFLMKMADMACPV